jgi:hypothetical protein
MKKIDAFILYSQPEQAATTVAELKQSKSIRNIFLLTPPDVKETLKGCKNIEIDSLYSCETIRKIARKCTSDFALLYQKSTVLRPGYFAMERMVQIAEDTKAEWFIRITHDNRWRKEKSSGDRLSGRQFARRFRFWFAHPLPHESFERCCTKNAGRKISVCRPLQPSAENIATALAGPHQRIPFTEAEEDTRLSGQKIFDYVDPKNRSSK